jgi:hypothetical protein
LVAIKNKFEKFEYLGFFSKNLDGFYPNFDFFFSKTLKNGSVDFLRLNVNPCQKISKF